MCFKYIFNIIYFNCVLYYYMNYLYRVRLFFYSNETHDQIGHMYAEFKLVKQNIQIVN